MFPHQYEAAVIVNYSKDFESLLLVIGIRSLAVLREHNALIQ